MEFLSQLGSRTICTPEWPTLSVASPLPPSYLGGDKGVELFASSVGLGSFLYDCKVSNSLIGRNVNIGKGTSIENSILMPNCVVGENCIIRNTIMDDGAQIPDNITIGVDSVEDDKNFFVSDGIVVLPKHFRY